ncbi:MAG: hypothetical protein ACM3ZV_07965 [Bacillota bacterium]
MAKGIFRLGDMAYVDYGRSARVAIPRSAYEANGYQPLFYQLPSGTAVTGRDQLQEAAS